MMTIAIACTEDEISPRLSLSRQFTLFQMDHGRIVSSRPVDCSDFARLTEAYNVDVLICGSLTDRERDACQRAGLMLFPGVAGSAEAAARAFADGSLEFDAPAAQQEA